MGDAATVKRSGNDVGAILHVQDVRALIIYSDVRSPASRHHMSACLTEISRPVVHQAAPTLEKIAARVGRLGGVLYRMGECGLDHLTRRIRLLRGPVPEARPEPMRHGGDAEFLGQSRERHGGEWLPTQTAEHEAGAIAQFLYLVQDRARPPRERNAGASAINCCYPALISF